ncbi:MAG: NADH-quinone oxidoreductase subunit A [Elusimicrobiota bacterium]
MSTINIIIVFIVSFIIAGGMILLSYLFGPKKESKIKSESFECGLPQIQKNNRAVKTNFYLIAVLFVVFDIEIIYLYPWSVYLKDISFYGFLSGIVFIIMLIIAFIYIYVRGAIKWD